MSVMTALSSALGANFAGVYDVNQFQSVGEILAALKRRAFLIAGIFLAGCLLSVNFALQQVKTYEATAVVQIEDANVTATGITTQAASAGTSRRLQLIEQRLMSRDNLLAVMERHNLFNDNPALGSGDRVFMMRQAARIQEITNNTNTFSATPTVPSGLIITVQLDDPVKAAEVANDLMETVIAQSRERAVRAARDTLLFYQTEEARIETEIVALEDRIAEFKQANADQLPAGISALRSQLTNLQDSQLTLDQQIITIQSDTTRRRAEDIARQVELLEEQKALIATRITQIEGQIASAPTVERELSRLEREMDRLTEQYGVVTRAKAEAEIGQALEDSQSGGRFEVLETALVPEHPMSSSRKKIAAAGGVAALLAGLGAALVAEVMNPAIRTPQQMERALGVRPVVAIPMIDTAQDRKTGGLRLLAKAAILLAGLAALAAWLVKTSGLGALFSPRGAEQAPAPGQ
ncbi:Wzz/FepE/Etk N-terminal domain-containing protein [Sagittula sp. SSi028]|uniref:Wzz/FepE/Etk N-terminal domain-containing protein n=1 Tax=Sagittula sp. SSi028 TaxID=3400636 RepID=UPI003AF94F0A